MFINNNNDVVNINFYVNVYITYKHYISDITNSYNNFINRTY